MMKINLFLAVMLSTSIIFGCSKKEAEPELNKADLPAEKTETDEEVKAPDFILKTTDNKDLKLSDYKGKIVILDFWATWCGPCRRSIPDLVEIQNEYKNDVVVIGISLDTHTIGNVVPFIKEYKINYPIVFGTEKVIRDYGDVNAIPTSFIIDKNGNVVDMYVGLVPKEAYTNKINNLLSKT